MSNTARIVKTRKARYAAAARVRAIVTLHKNDPVRYGLFIADSAYRKQVLDDASAQAGAKFERMGHAARVGAGQYSPPGDQNNITTLPIESASAFSAALHRSDTSFFTAQGGDFTSAAAFLHRLIPPHRIELSAGALSKRKQTAHVMLLTPTKK